ncbi:MAG: radical SAM protein [Methanomassiliicoccales archaeon]|jgi:wyosine [tRNA(Phe)-imidazoG37] synthetase (radical SAM superfamily)
MKAVYGPVRSWRLGLAMGVDPICKQPKVCNLKCVYCRLGHGGITITERGRFVDEKQVQEEARELLRTEKIDAVMIRGTGEPFLAKNLIDIVHAVRKETDRPIGVITNGSLFQRQDVLDDLNEFDIAVVKLDAADAACFSMMNRPHGSVDFEKLIESFKRAKSQSACDLRIQVTFVRANMYQAEQIADICRDIGVKMIYISTPVRSEGMDLNKKDMQDLANIFRGFKVKTVFDEKSAD